MAPDVEERFQRIEALLMETAELSLKTERKLDRISDHQQQTQTHLDELSQDFKASIEDLVQLGMDTMNLVAENSNQIRTMQTEIRGLQVENRRILRELRDRRQGE
jgi:predicted transcriptional regulator